MKKIISPLFAGLTDAEYEAMMGCNFFSTKKYRKGEPILLTGDVTRNLCVVISGGVNIENIDLWGNRSILSNVGAGQIFAETYAITRHHRRSADGRCCGSRGLRSFVRQRRGAYFLPP